MLARLLRLYYRATKPDFLRSGRSVAQKMGVVQENDWTQSDAAQHLRLTQPRVSDLMRGKTEKFSLDMLITLAARCGRRVEMAVYA